MIINIIVDLFTTFVYQPFFNLLVGVYYSLRVIPDVEQDMGIAVIIFTVVFRILWLPISLSSDRKEKDKRELAKKVQEARLKYAKDPARRKLEVKKLMHTNRGLVIAAAINIGFQVIIALMLYRIFTRGLEGADFHLLYPFISQPSEPFNLMFLDKYDLSHPNLFLNFVQTVCIFVIEFLSVVFSPLPATRKDLTTVFVLPVISYVFFLAMPAGKKLFIITTLLFSIMLMLVKRGVYWYHTLSNKIDYWVEKKTVNNPAEQNGV